MKAPYDYEALCPDCQEDDVEDLVSSEVEDRYGEYPSDEEIEEVRAEILSECKLCYSCYKANHDD
jgi:hypothetical protein